MLSMHTLKYRSKSHVLACFVVPVVLLSLVGCNNSKKKDDTKKAPSDVALQRDQLSKIDAWAVEVPLQASVENAVIRQRVLYDYHFVDGVVRLTPVGRRDARILAKHYKGTQWELNFKQGRASDELYQQRLNAIVIMMKANGVALTDLTIVDGMPGGQGIASTDARRIRADSIKGAGSLSSGDGYDGGTTVVKPLDTPLEGGF
jgi:hypothetical protein